MNLKGKCPSCLMVLLNTAGTPGEKEAIHKRLSRVCNAYPSGVPKPVPETCDCDGKIPLLTDAQCDARNRIIFRPLLRGT